MESYIRQLQSFDMLQNRFDIKSDSSKRKREDCALEDIRLRVENLLGLANELIVNKSCPIINPKETTSFVAPREASATPSRIPRRSPIPQNTPNNSGSRSRSVTPQRVVQNRIQYFKAMSQNKNVYKTILSQERDLGIERTSIPISVNIKTSQRFGDLQKPVPLFGRDTSDHQNASVFVFAAPTPGRSIPRLVKTKTHTGLRKKTPPNLNNADTPSKIPVLDKSKYFAADSRIAINRKSG